MSAAYYAMFHALAKECADIIVGKSSNHPNTWVQVYRALDHRDANRACKAMGTKKQFPPTIRSFAATFVAMQAHRHTADYDPSFGFVRAAVNTSIAEAEQAIKDLRLSPRVHRLVALVLLKERR